MCAQTRPRFILSSERVLGGMEFEPMLTPREKSRLPENFPRGGSNPRRCGQRAQTLPTSYSGPIVGLRIALFNIISTRGSSSSVVVIVVVIINLDVNLHIDYCTMTTVTVTHTWDVVCRI